MTASPPRNIERGGATYVLFSVFLTFLGCQKQQQIVCPRIQMPFSELRAELDAKPVALSNGEQAFSSVQVFGVLGSLVVGIDSANQRVNSIKFYPADSRSDSVQEQILKVLQDTLGPPYSVTGDPKEPNFRKRAWHASGNLSYILETDYHFTRFHSDQLDTISSQEWNYANTGHLDELDLGKLINERFTLKTLQEYLQGRCLHVEKNSGEGETHISFWPVFVCGVPGELDARISKVRDLDTVPFDGFVFSTKLSYIESFGDTVSQNGSSPGMQVVQSGRDLINNFGSCIATKYLGKTATVDYTNPSFEANNIRADFWGVGNDTGYHVEIYSRVDKR